MSEPQVTMSGPARLRRVANRMDLVDYEMALDLRQMAALWEADLIGGEVCAEARAAGSGPCGSCAWCVKQATDRAERAEAEADGWQKYSERLVLEVHQLKNQLAFPAALERCTSCMAESGQTDDKPIRLCERHMVQYIEGRERLKADNLNNFNRAERAEAALEAEQRTRLAMTRAWQKNEAALEQARALLAEQAEIITANVWHIPPEYSARNIVLDAAAKMRELAALLSPAEGGAA